MCGITGFIDFTNGSSEEILRAMATSLTHRGPDGDGIYLNASNGRMLGLAHRRLSIIDLNPGASQPMSYDGLHITFNGEIYNYQEIKDRLVSLGHTFQTHSDTEVILHAWREWGEESITLWHGMFSIVLFDELSDSITCIRDRAGVKPFFYYYRDGLFLFGSELKSLLQHPAFKKRIDLLSVASFLQYGYVGGTASIYQDTFKLLPGHLLNFSLLSRNITTRQYWNVYDYYNRPKLDISMGEAIAETEKILAESFKYRMVADVPVGLFLSGGYDSTCVTALLQKDNPEKIKTFTIGSIDSKTDEAPYAKNIAAHLKTDHTEYYCSLKEATAIIPDLPIYFDEPFADSSAIPTILVSRMARKKVTVALSADGGDEIFAGYNRYDYIKRYGKKIRSIPAPIRNMLAFGMNKIPSDKIPFLRNRYNFHGRYDKVKNLLHNPSTPELLKNLSQAFTGQQITRIIKRTVAIPETDLYSKELVNAESDPLAYMMAADFQTYMVDDILQKVDRATMSVALEGREPFLDQQIIEWAAQLPSEYKYHNGVKKYIIREIVHKYVPKEMMDRPKMGFGIPVEQWLKTELKPLVFEYLNEHRLQQHGLFEEKEVMNIVTQFYNGRTEKHLQVWYLLMFQLWYEHWMTKAADEK